jgi:hypothetical protein
MIPSPMRLLRLATVVGLLACALAILASRLAGPAPSPKPAPPGPAWPSVPVAPAERLAADALAHSELVSPQADPAILGRQVAALEGRIVELASALRRAEERIRALESESESEKGGR